MEVLRDVRPRDLRLTRAVRGCAVLLGALLLAIAPSPAPAQGLVHWPVKTREHVDLWLHGFALVAADSSPVPLYRRGYRDALLVARNAANATTDLDTYADALRTTLASRPALVGAQFLPLAFGSWAEFDATLDAFLKSDGGARPRNDATGRGMAAIASVFRTREERDFAKKFVAGVRSEREKFHHQWWLDESRRRAASLAAVDSAWQRVVRPKLQGFLNHLQQPDGEIILSMVLEGEGRTAGSGKSDNTITCGWPQAPEQAMDAIDCVLHELVGPIVAVAVDDNVTPAEKRNGTADRLQSLALVRGGALLAARLGADVAAGYEAFYLRAAGRDAGTDPAAAFAAAFPIPEPMRASIERQIAVAFGGI